MFCQYRSANPSLSLHRDEWYVVLLQVYAWARWILQERGLQFLAAGGVLSLGGESVACSVAMHLLLLAFLLLLVRHLLLVAMHLLPIVSCYY